VLRVAPDTNIYVSALNFGGVPEPLLRVAEAGIIQVVTSDIPPPASVKKGEIERPAT
jgi:predicted nucleic acid-binding protein